MGFEDRVTVDAFDWPPAVQLARGPLQHVFTLEFLARREHAFARDPVGVGKAFLAQALGAASVRAGQGVLCRRADALLAKLGWARADSTYERAFCNYLASDLVSLDDVGLRRLTAQQFNAL